MVFMLSSSLSWDVFSSEFNRGTGSSFNTNLLRSDSLKLLDDLGSSGLVGGPMDIVISVSVNVENNVRELLNSHLVGIGLEFFVLYVDVEEGNFIGVHKHVFELGLFVAGEEGPDC